MTEVQNLQDPRGNPDNAAKPRWVTNDTGRRDRRWFPMRKGVIDLWRTYQVGIAANHRNLDALTAARP